MNSKVMLGPFSKVYREPELRLLRFMVPETLRYRIVEPALRGGLKISPEKIIRAYKNIHGRLWILVEFERGYDLYKHFKLSSRDKYARRIPRIVVEACPKPRCGEDLVDRFCPDCLEEVERPKYLEVWRDSEAVEEIMLLEKIEIGRDYVALLIAKEWIKIPRQLLHEHVVSLVKRSDGTYIKYLRITSPLV